MLRASLGLLTLLIELRYTLSRLIANPLTSAFVPAFQALRAQWTAVQAMEISLNEALSDAKAQVDIADAALDDFARRFSIALLALTGQDETDGLYLHYFKVSLHQLARPTLRGQLVTMTGWLTSLADPLCHPTLAAMAPELKKLTDDGAAAQNARDTLVIKIRTFRDVGERAQLFDAVNAERKSTEGALKKLALATPGLATSFSAEFFKPGEADEPPPETVDSVSSEIDVLNEKLKERDARLKELQKEATDAAVLAAANAAKQAQLDALNKDIEAKKKEAQALMDELNK
jgi:hypothetical protein